MSNRRFFLLTTFIVLVIAAWPFVSGKIITPKGALFYGNQALAPGDFSVYYSYILQGRQGHLFMYDAFTSEAHAATLFQPVWFIVGQLSRIGNLSPINAFAFSRLAVVPLLLGVLWWAAKWLWRDDVIRQRTAFILSIIGSGLGGLGVVFFHAEIWRFADVWVSEAFTMLTLWSSAHFILVTSGILFFLISVERSWEERSWRRMFWASIVAAGVTSVHPFHVLTWLVFAVFAIIWHWTRERKFPRQYMLRWLCIGLSVMPAVFLFGTQLLFDPLTIGRAVQNINPTRSPLAFVVGLGLPFVFFLIALTRRLWRREFKTMTMQWLVLVLCAYAVAIYLPVGFQRRLSQGMMIIVCWAAVPVASWLVQQTILRKNIGRISLGVLMVFLISFTWLYDASFIHSERVADLRLNQRMYYVSAEYQSLTRYLSTINPHQPVLSTILEGNVLAGLTAHQMYIGYPVETLQYDVKQQHMEQFYQSMTENEQRSMLAQAALCYVIDSPRTQGYGHAFQPSTWPDLRVLWRGSTITVYQTPYCRS